MKLYKLTDENGCTKNGTQWGENVTHRATGDPSQDLCSDAWIHAYESPELAVLMNPIHANFKSPRLWEAEGEIGKNDGTKCGCRSLTTVKEIPLPQVTIEQRVRFGILAAVKVYKDAVFQQWAADWLSGANRTDAAANAASYAANTSSASATTASASAAYAIPLKDIAIQAIQEPPKP
jgi:hypothetical protein